MSDDQANRPTLLRFGDYELDTTAAELRRRGTSVRLQQQPCRVLAVLAERAGELVTRDEIRRAVWGDTYVNFDQSLNFCIKEIRAALGDQADTPRFIETLPRRGYRFLLPVDGEVESASEAIAEPSPKRSATYRWLSLVLPLVAMGLFVVAYLGPLGGGAPAGANGERVRLAVLPFENLSTDPAQDYLSDGLTEEMIAQLGQLEPQRLAVIARTSAMRYRGRDKDIDEIGRELGADYVIEGSVRRGVDRVRITVKLIQVSDQTQLWAEAYDRPLQDLLTIQREVAQAVARSIELKLSPDFRERLEQAPAVDPEAYELFLQGRHFQNRRDRHSLERSVELFSQAVEREPGFALGYVGLSQAYIVLADHGHLAPAAALPKARIAAQRALELDPSLAEAQGAVAMIRGIFDWDWEGAEKGFVRALELGPNSATLHLWYSHVLRAQRRTEEAVAATRRALELDPLSLVINNNYGSALFYAGRYPEAAEQYRLTLEMDDEWVAGHWGLGRTLLRTGDVQEALGYLERAAELSGMTPQTLAYLAHGYGFAGQEDEAREVWAHMQEMARERYVSPYDQAVALTAVGDRDGAFEALEAAYAEHQSMLRMLVADDRLERLRNDPRFSDLARRINLQ